jgi:hypothetical protein
LRLIAFESFDEVVAGFGSSNINLQTILLEEPAVPSEPQRQLRRSIGIRENRH